MFNKWRRGCIRLQVLRVMQKPVWKKKKKKKYATIGSYPKDNIDFCRCVLRLATLQHTVHHARICVHK